VTAAIAGSKLHLVRVWFGRHVIASYKADPEAAAQYAAAMERRYCGLRVTDEPMPTPVPELRRMPCERLWDLPPH